MLTGNITPGGTYIFLQECYRWYALFYQHLWTKSLGHIIYQHTVSPQMDVEVLQYGQNWLELSNMLN